MLPLARSSLYYAPKGESAENLRFIELIDKQVLETVAELRHRFEQRWRRYGSRHPLTHIAYALPDSGWHDTCSVMVTNAVAIYCPAGFVGQIPRGVFAIVFAA
jgi:hypothetical protein